VPSWQAHLSAAKNSSTSRAAKSVAGSATRARRARWARSLSTSASRLPRDGRGDVAWTRTRATSEGEGIRGDCADTPPVYRYPPARATSLRKQRETRAVQRYLVSGGEDATVRVLDLATGSRMFTIETGWPVTALAVIARVGEADGPLLAIPSAGLPWSAPRVGVARR
jgi:hypothetical protein